MKTTVFCGSGAALIDFGGTLTELRAGSLVTDRSAVIAPYEHLPELQHIEESSFPNRLQHYVTSLASRPSVVRLTQTLSRFPTGPSGALWQIISSFS